MQWWFNRLCRGMMYGVPKLNKQAKQIQDFMYIGLHLVLFRIECIYEVLSSPECMKRTGFMRSWRWGFSHLVAFRGKQLGSHLPDAPCTWRFLQVNCFDVSVTKTQNPGTLFGKTRSRSNSAVIRDWSHLVLQWESPPLMHLHSCSAFSTKRHISGGASMVLVWILVLFEPKSAGTYLYICRMLVAEISKKKHAVSLIIALHRRRMSSLLLLRPGLTTPPNCLGVRAMLP